MQEAIRSAVSARRATGCETTKNSRMRRSSTTETVLQHFQCSLMTLSPEITASERAPKCPRRAGTIAHLLPHARNESIRTWPPVPHKIQPQAPSAAAGACHISIPSPLQALRRAWRGGLRRDWREPSNNGKREKSKTS